MSANQLNANSKVTRSLVVLRPDGTVESVNAEISVTWIGRMLSEIHEAPAAVREAGARLVHAPPGASMVRREVIHLSTNRDSTTESEIELLLVEALPLRRTYTRVGDLIMRTLETFAVQAQSCDVDLHVERAPNVPPVLMVDGEKIAWAVATIVGNSLRFAQQRGPKNGRVQVKLVLAEPTAELVITVHDNGSGMSAHQARWLFDRDPATGMSAGLALVMVRDVIAAHRGSLAVESHSGHGTTFTLKIPSIQQP